MTNAPEKKVVLYAEDDDNDAFLMRRAFKKVGVPNSLHIVDDGKMAISYLAGEGVYADRASYPLPALLLLDLKMPRMTGLEVLAWVRERSEFQSLTVIMFTSSTQDRDVKSAFALKANAYLVKPPDPARLLRIVADLQHVCLGEEPPLGWLKIEGNVAPA